MTQNKGQAPEALTSLAHEIFTLAQLAPGEGIEDAVARISATLHAQQPAPAAGEVVAHRVMRENLEGKWVCDGRYWSDGAPSKELVDSICADKTRWRVDVAYAAPQSSPMAQAADSVPALPTRPSAKQRLKSAPTKAPSTANGTKSSTR